MNTESRRYPSTQSVRQPALMLHRGARLLLWCTLGLALALLATLAASAQAREPASSAPASEQQAGTELQASQNVEFVGQIDGPSNAVAVSGTLAYVAARGSPLVIYDIADPAHPTVAGQTATTGDTSDIVLAGSYVHVTRDAPGGVGIIDVANPAAPTWAGCYSNVGWNNAVAVAGSYAYVAHTSYFRSSSRLLVFSLANPAAPVQVGYLDTPGECRSVAVAGDYAYLVDDTANLLIVNVAARTLVGSYHLGSFLSAVAVVGSYAYIADWSSGLRIIDVANPDVPTEVGSYNAGPGFYAEGVAVSGSYAYVIDPIGRSLRIINVANPAAPVQVGFYNTTESPVDVAVAGDYIFVAQESVGVSILRFTGEPTPTLTPTPTTTASATPTPTPTITPSVTPTPSSRIYLPLLLANWED